MLLKPTNARPTRGAKFPVLASYALARKSMREFERLAERDDVEILLDCGAFTALNAGHAIELSDYMSFLRQWGSRLFGYLALDVIGNPSATDRNLQIMLDAGLRPIPVHVRGDDARRMDQLFELSDWVACGGLRRPHTGHSSPSYVKQKMIWAQGRNVHWLGYTSSPMVQAFKPYSCDCSNWASGHRWGELCIYLGNLQWSNRGNLAAGALKTPFSQQEVAFFAEIGLSPADVRDTTRWRVKKGVCSLGQMIPSCVTAYSWVKYAREVRETVGTRVFIAITFAHASDGGELDLLTRMIELTS